VEFLAIKLKLLIHVIIDCQSGSWRRAGGNVLNSGAPGSICTSGTYCNRANGTINCVAGSGHITAGFVTSGLAYVLGTWNGSQYIGNGYNSQGTFVDANSYCVPSGAFLN